jgi:hypothetical protein
MLLCTRLGVPTPVSFVNFAVSGEEPQDMTKARRLHCGHCLKKQDKNITRRIDVAEDRSSL